MCFILMQKCPLEGILRSSRKEAVAKLCLLPCAPPVQVREKPQVFKHAPSQSSLQGLRAGRDGLSPPAPQCVGYTADSRQEEGNLVCS